MNFFGHAVLAAGHSSEQSFLIGAMLPDLVSMSGLRRIPACPPRMNAGIAFHHLTDELFHGAPAFRALERRASAELARRGLPRGSARAVAHVGTELLIDAVLGRVETSRRAYLGAVAWAQTPAALSPLVWPTEQDGARLERVLSALAERGTEVLDASPTAIAMRLGRVLQHRPRLALGSTDTGLVEGWVGGAFAGVERATGALLEELAQQFRRRGVALAMPPLA